MRCEPSNRNIHVCAFSAAQTEWKNISIFGPLSVSARFRSTRAVSIWFIFRSLCDFAFHFSRICVVFLCVLHVDFQLICLPTSVRQRQSFFFFSQAHHIAQIQRNNLSTLLPTKSMVPPVGPFAHDRLN